MRVFATVDELTAAVGEPLGPSEWLTITQDQVNKFADATGDHQWIHVDTERAAAGPFGTTIAHGYLTLSLLPMLAAQLIEIATPGPKLNYGLDKVRFPSPVKVGGRIQATGTIESVTGASAGVLLRTRYVVAIEGGEKPACVADTLTLCVLR